MLSSDSQLSEMNLPQGSANRKGEALHWGLMRTNIRNPCAMFDKPKVMGVDPELIVIQVDYVLG